MSIILIMVDTAEDIAATDTEYMAGLECMGERMVMENIISAA